MASTMTMDQKRNHFRTFRRTGDLAAISTKTGYSRSYVSEVLGGKYNNERIVNVAFERTRKRKTA